MRFIRVLEFLAMAAAAYRRCETEGGVTYIAAVHPTTGVPRVAMFVGIDREAWRISQVAIDAKFSGSFRRALPGA